jgi:hypothetical protein
MRDRDLCRYAPRAAPRLRSSTRWNRYYPAGTRFMKRDILDELPSATRDGDRSSGKAILTLLRPGFWIGANRDSSLVCGLLLPIRRRAGGACQDGDDQREAPTSAATTSCFIALALARRTSRRGLPRPQISITAGRPTLFESAAYGSWKR